MTLSTIFKFLPRYFLNQNILLSVLGLLFVGFVSVIFYEPVEERIGPFSGLSNLKNEILTFLGVGMGGVLLTLFRKYMMIFLMIFLISILGLLFVGFVSVMFSKTVEEYIGTLFGLSGQKKEILTFLGIGMGGLLVPLRALMSYIRAKAEDTAKQQVIANQNTQKGLQQERLRMEETANAQARANQNTENGLRQERLKNAIEHLGNDSDSVRLGGAYELFHLAQDNPELSQTVLDILCAHIRRTTSEDEYRKTHKSKPSQEVQSLLTLLFVQDHDVFNGLQINLQESWLNWANLRGARLRKANLTRASLQKTVLIEAQLQEVILFGAHLHEVNLTNAHLQGANLYEAQLHGAKLNSAKLHGADISSAKLHGAQILGTQMYGVSLSGAQLQGAYLNDARMQGAHLGSTNLKGVKCQQCLYDEFEKIMRQSIDQQSDLSTVTFAGRLTKKEFDSIAEELSDEKAMELRKKLEPHIGNPISNNLPENSHAITGAYNKKEAEKWIAEYEKAMSEIPTDEG